VIWALAAVGLASDLKRTPDPAIVRARLRMDERRLAVLAVPPAAEERLRHLRACIDRAAVRWHEAVARYEASKGAATKQMRAALATCRSEMRAAGRDLRSAYARWRRALSVSPAELARVGAR